MDGELELEAPFYSSLDSDFSTGYLEDALLEFNERTKRRRLLLYTDHETDSSKDLEKVFLVMGINNSSYKINDGSESTYLIYIYAELLEFELSMGNVREYIFREPVKQFQSTLW